MCNFLFFIFIFYFLFLSTPVSQLFSATLMRSIHHACSNKRLILFQKLTPLCQCNSVLFDFSSIPLPLPSPLPPSLSSQHAHTKTRTRTYVRTHSHSLTHAHTRYSLQARIRRTHMKRPAHCMEFVSMAMEVSKPSGMLILINSKNTY